MRNRQAGVEPFALGEETKAVLLVGGLGTRLRSVVASSTKSLAFVGSEPFLELFVRQLRRQGIHGLIMCTGYLAEQIENEFGDGKARGTQNQVEETVVCSFPLLQPGSHVVVYRRRCTTGRSVTTAVLSTRARLDGAMAKRAQLSRPLRYKP